MFLKLTNLTLWGYGLQSPLKYKLFNKKLLEIRKRMLFASKSNFGPKFCFRSSLIYRKRSSET